MKKISRRSFLAATAALAAASLTAGCSGPGDGKTHLTFQIWDVAQRDGMQAMCDAYTVQHPDVVIEVQVTSWNEYWTKLEAATMARQAPDIFWMHTNEILKYADNGKLPDCSAVRRTQRQGLCGPCLQQGDVRRRRGQLSRRHLDLGHPV